MGSIIIWAAWWGNTSAYLRMSMQLLRLVAVAACASVLTLLLTLKSQASHQGLGELRAHATADETSTPARPKSCGSPRSVGNVTLRATSCERLRRVVRSHRGPGASEEIEGVAVLLSSTSPQHYARATTAPWLPTVGGALEATPLWLLVDDGVAFGPHGAAPSTPAAQRSGVCVDRLAAYGSEQFSRLAASKFRAVEEFYARYGAWEPFEGAMVVQSGKVLVLKVAAIDAALHALPLGAVVVWLDADVEVRRPLDAAFLAFARTHDVAYDVPFRPGERGFRIGWHDETWRVESGVMVFSVSRRSRALSRAALEWYVGGAGRIRALCARPPDSTAAAECSRSWLSSNVFLNDVYCWAALLHGARRNSTVLRRALKHFDDELVGLNQAWLSSSTSPSACAAGDVAPPVRSVCPGMVCHAAPFETSRYFLHKMKSSGTYSALSRSVRSGVSDADAALSTASFERMHLYFRRAEGRGGQAHAVQSHRGNTALFQVRGRSRRA